MSLSVCVIQYRRLNCWTDTLIRHEHLSLKDVGS